jgi:phosphoribosylformimino-5-aminoimidazole carboxamide ribotide isomerase
MILIPAIDVLDGAVVRLTEGKYDSATQYDADPIASARRWVDEGATFVHVVDLEAARSGRSESQLALCAGLSKAGVAFQIGGGIRSASVAKDALDAGAQRVVVGTAALSLYGPLSEIVQAVGAERLVVAVDVRDGRARGSGWLDGGEELSSVLAHLQSSGVVRILVTGITTDGRMEGPDTDLLAGVQRVWPQVHIIASGGVGSVADLETLDAQGYEAVVVGRALFERRFTLAEGLDAVTG